MEPANITVILSIIATVVSVGSFFITRKTAGATVESIYQKLNKEQALRIEELEEKVTEVMTVQRGLQRALNERDEYIIILLDGNGRLNKQLKDCEQVPCWEPPKPDFLYKLNGSRENGVKV
jgi:hypothetical protein